MELAEQAFGIGKQVTVPGIAGPAYALSELVHMVFPRTLRPGLVPVHVDDHHVHGNLPVAELLAERQQLVGGIRPVAAPPVAEHELRGKGNLSGHLGEIGQSGLVVMAVGEDIEVLHLALGTLAHPVAPVRAVLHEDVPGALVNYGPAVTGKDAELQRVVVIDLVGALAAVKRPGGAHQVAVGLHSGMPFDPATVHPEAHAQVGLVEAAITRIVEGQRGSPDPDRIAVTGDPELGNRKVAVDDSEGRMVLKLPVFGPFHAHEPVGQHREAGVTRNDAGLGVRDGIHFVGSGRHGTGSCCQQCRKQTPDFHIIIV